MPPQTQNIYDNPDFFTAYSTLPRSQHGLRGAPEWPVLRDMVLSNNSNTNANTSNTNPETTNGLQNCKVLDLGCGYGWFSRWARDSACADFVRGIDVSERMIERAKKFDSDDGGYDSAPKSKHVISYQHHDLETLTLDQTDPDTYHVVYSSLAFHYISNLGSLFRQIHACLVKGGSSSGSPCQNNSKRGKLVFSVEHPVFSAPVYPPQEWRDIPAVAAVKEEGRERGEQGEEEKGTTYTVWPLNSYCEEGLRETSWLGSERVRKYHRTIETYVTLLLESGFVVTGLKEWAPSREDVAAKKEWERERHRPYFLLVSAEPRCD
ncbi:hypothetical protein N7474_009854 [Penicillium riverlandense]|uniref:uncharacterized protein n=1 Tax=Penicillium riverlandense TaxID=1903569 RepID=UPI0025494AC9|nr:uncharacterized protein N7474_009854 [Penicillium riverlandense]KAJ5808585.1 hypothetical protein N7474_009854 [Penicillium riverlandense]